MSSLSSCLLHPYFHVSHPGWESLSVLHEIWDPQNWSRDGWSLLVVLYDRRKEWCILEKVLMKIYFVRSHVLVFVLTFSQFNFLFFCRLLSNPYCQLGICFIGTCADTQVGSPPMRRKEPSRLLILKMQQLQQATKMGWLVLWLDALPLGKFVGIGYTAF